MSPAERQLVKEWREHVIRIGIMRRTASAYLLLHTEYGDTILVLEGEEKTEGF